MYCLNRWYEIDEASLILDTKRNELVMDFIVKRVDNTTHVLNAVSPAFTSAFSFAKYILNK